METTLKTHIKQRKEGKKNTIQKKNDRIFREMKIREQIIVVTVFVLVIQFIATKWRSFTIVRTESFI